MQPRRSPASVRVTKTAAGSSHPAAEASAALERCRRSPDRSRPPARPGRAAGGRPARRSGPSRGRTLAWSALAPGGRSGGASSGVPADGASTGSGSESCWHRRLLEHHPDRGLRRRRGPVRNGPRSGPAGTGRAGRPRPHSGGGDCRWSSRAHARVRPQGRPDGPGRRAARTAASAAACAPIAASSGPDGRGICGVRENRDGHLVSLAYGAAVAIGIDPIEKKPLFHVAPGTTAYSIATAGCPFHCTFCQNWEIAQGPRLGLDLPARRCRRPEVVDEAPSPTAPVRSPTPTSSRRSSSSTPSTPGGSRATPGCRNLFITDGYATPEAVDLLAPRARRRERRSQVVRRRLLPAAVRRAPGPRPRGDRGDAPGGDLARADDADHPRPQRRRRGAPRADRLDRRDARAPRRRGTSAASSRPTGCSTCRRRRSRRCAGRPTSVARRASRHVYVGNAPELGLEDTRCAGCGRRAHRAARLPGPQPPRRRRHLSRLRAGARRRPARADVRLRRPRAAVRLREARR